MQAFGEPPAYSSFRVLAAALLCIFGGIAHGLAGIFDLSASWVPGFLMLGLAVALFLFGVVLLIRFVEARDAMTDFSPRVRLYDARHERGVYLAGLSVALLALLADALWMSFGNSLWHLAPALLPLAAAWLLFRLWSRRPAPM